MSTNIINGFEITNDLTITDGQLQVSTNDVDSSLDGISASEINRTHIISSVPLISTFRISVISPASVGSISGGGTDVIATFQN